MLYPLSYGGSRLARMTFYHGWECEKHTEKANLIASILYFFTSIIYNILVMRRHHATAIALR